MHLARLLLLLVLAACAAHPRVATMEPPRAPVTILISVDGLHPDYLDRGVTPAIGALASGGVKAAMRPPFPSVTFPGHHSLVTGLVPDRHGIVNNRMADPRRPGVFFTLGNASQSLDPFWWDAAEPIWVTAEKAGVRTATMFWPGTEVAIGGRRPSDWLRFDSNISNVQRVNQVLDWMRRPQAIRPRFVTLYFDTVDVAGHAHGPNAAETTAALAEVDQRIADLVAGLAALGQPANIVLTSDHGMAEVHADRVFRIDSLVPPEAGTFVFDGALAGIDPAAGREADVAAVLLKPHAQMECWRKSEVPARFRFGANARVPAILCLAGEGWFLLSREPDARGLPKGMHGYDNSLASMRALFIANGPAFAAGTSVPEFDNVDVYPLLARLVGVTPVAGTDAKPTLDAILKGASN